MCIVYTNQIKRGQPSHIDTTVKSSVGKYRLLAPTWDLVNGHKEKKITDDEYTEAYLILLRSRWRSGLNQLFRELLAMDEFSLYCYCRGDGRFCHRHILVDILEKAANDWEIPFVRGGELSTKKKSE